jgi:hypothetical protein
MADIVADLAAKCGIDTEQARQGLGAVLTLLKNNLSPEAYAKVNQLMPNADSMIAEAASTCQGEPQGMLAAVARSLGKICGGGSEDAIAKLGQLGFSGEQLQAFVPKVLEFLKGKLPEDAMKQISGLLPVPEEAAH